MAILKDFVLTTFCPQIEIKTINIKTITVLFSRQDSNFCTRGRFESNSMTVSFKRAIDPPIYNQIAINYPVKET